MKLREQNQARKLREQGYSIKEIAKALTVSQSSASIWVRDVQLSKNAKNRLLSKIKRGQYVAAENKKAKRRAKEKAIGLKAKKFVSRSKIGVNQEKLMCALIYWCEGAKDSRNGINFTNSDPKLTAKFLELLRGHFQINETRLKARIHLHDYHNEKIQVKFWSETLGIPRKAFLKAYRKPNTKKRYRKNYPGCIAIRYGDTDLAREMNALAKAYLGYTM